MPDHRTTADHVAEIKVINPFITDITFEEEEDKIRLRCSAKKNGIACGVFMIIARRDIGLHKLISNRFQDFYDAL